MGLARPATRLGVAALAITLALPTAPHAAVAQPPAAPAARAARDAELARVKAERAALETRLRALRATAGDLREEAGNYDRQADATARLVATLDRQLVEIGDDVRQANERLARAEARLAVEQRGLRRRLVEIYKRGPLREAEVLLSASSFGDLVARYKYLHDLTARDRTLLRRVEGLRNGVRAERALVVRLQADLQRNRVEQAAEERRLRELQAQRGLALVDVEGEARRAQARLAQVARDERRLEGLIAAAETARRRSAARASPRVGARAGAGTADEPPAPPPVAGTLRTSDLARIDWPVDGRILYRFGRAAAANRTVTRWNGIGIAAAPGTPVRAVAAGTVVVAEAIGTYGVTVIVQHGGDYSVYGSLARADVVRGATVTRGQVVGAVGAADPDLPPHLHFEVRPGGRAVDPLDWLRANR